LQRKLRKKSFFLHCRKWTKGSDRSICPRRVMWNS